MIGILDYGLGNISAFKRLFYTNNIKTKVINSPADFSEVSKIIFPGVGAFDWAMSKLDKSGLRETLDTLVLDRKIPILGICVGMQMMASRSEEGILPGLNWIKGKVLKFDENTLLPHMGWNNVKVSVTSKIFNNMENPEFYFLHSYYYQVEDAKNILATSEYGELFSSAINKENIFGTQFHPEKSHENGIKILENFVKIKC